MKLNDICEVYSGYALKEFNNNSNGFPVIKIGNIIADGSIALDDCQFTTEIVNEKYYSLYGDIYVALSGATTGKIGIMQTNQKHIVNQRVGIVRKKNNDFPDAFIKYFLMHQTDRILQEASGCAQPNISPKQIALYEIPEIKHKEILKIVDTLDNITNIIKLRQQQLTKLDELVKARFVEMFGTIHDNKFGYEIKILQDVCEQIKDGTHQTPIYTDDNVNGYKFLSSKDVTTGKIDWTHLKYIPEELHNELYARIAPKKGDILLAKNGTTGIAAIVDRDEVFDIYVSLALLRPIEINSVYLWAAINSVETKQQFDSSLKGIGVPNLHLGEIKKAKIIIPPVECQNQFVAFVEQVDKSKIAVQKALDEAQTLFDSLMQQYFG